MRMNRVLIRLRHCGYLAILGTVFVFASSCSDSSSERSQYVDLEVVVSYDLAAGWEVRKAPGIVGPFQIVGRVQSLPGEDFNGHVSWGGRQVDVEVPADSRNEELRVIGVVNTRDELDYVLLSRLKGAEKSSLRAP